MDKTVELKAENIEFSKMVQANDQLLLEKELKAREEKEKMMQELTNQRLVHANIRKNLKLKADKERKAEEIKYIERLKNEEKQEQEAQLRKKQEELKKY
jgi:hypothetical protein